VITSIKIIVKATMTNDKRVVVTSDIEVQVHGKDWKLYLHAIQK